MEAIQVDGMDVLEVMRRTGEIVEKTRSDSQPRFIEAVTYRFKGHSVVDPDKYRSDVEKEHWREQDPVARFEAQLRKAGLAGDKDFAQVAQAVEQEVEDSVKAADEAADPPTSELYRYMYAGEWEARAGA
jgi:pyruvate dehydrogenase E1 component alpha subunit